MAPELLAGKPASTRSDIYSLGVVLYQLLVGDFQDPVTTDWPERIGNPLLQEDLRRCLAGKPEERHSSPAYLARSLRSLPERQKALAAQLASAAARQRAQQLWRWLRVGGAVALILALGLSLAWFFRMTAKVRWARERALPQIEQLAKTGRTFSAFALAQQAERYLPHDPAMSNLWSQISVRALVSTTPQGAEVYIKDYAKPDTAWQHLGKSPLNGVLAPRGFHRWQIKKPGYASLERADYARPDPLVEVQPGTNEFVLEPESLIPPGMVRVPGGQLKLPLKGLDSLAPVTVAPFFIDEFEVSNRQFKEFVDRGGYRTTNFWKQPFVKGGQTLTWAEAVAEFRDSTGQSGPATWKNGTYPDGEDDYPVTGVSWYEAAAYAEYVGKRLPSIYQWGQAASPSFAGQMVLLSNFGGQGPARPGQNQGCSSWGAYDMAGNAAEWCWNEAASGKRYLLGGSWRDPEYMFLGADADFAFERSLSSGFRCAKGPTNDLRTEMDLPILPVIRDYTKEQPVSDEVFRIYKGLYAYDKTPLDARVEETDNTPAQWREERVSFQAAYGNERVTAVLFLPKNSSPPYQVVVFFPGSTALVQRSSRHIQRWGTDYLVASGRAVMYPIFKSTYERGDDVKNNRPARTSTYRDHVIMWSKDLGRSLDYLETRPDIQHDKVGYYGLSWGAGLGAILPALESRIKVNVLVAGGFWVESTFPEVDQINFAPRVTVPTLALNGRYDFIFPPDTSQVPMLRLLGAPPEHKRHAILESGHALRIPQIEQEVLGWLDKYLGPVK
jgi:formylglycine-generating enzyme required for sulfatase activity/dienelactone hydrolase